MDRITECGVCRWIGIEIVDTDYLIICTRGEIFAIMGEADRMYGARVVAHGGELFRLGVVLVRGIGDGVCGPNTNVAICSW